MEFSYFFSMRLHLKNILLSLVTLLVIACTTDNEYDVTAYQGLINGNTSYSEEALDLGVKNAVKKKAIANPKFDHLCVCINTNLSCCCFGTLLFIVLKYY